MRLLLVAAIAALSLAPFGAAPAAAATNPGYVCTINDVQSCVLPIRLCIHGPCTDQQSAAVAATKPANICQVGEILKCQPHICGLRGPCTDTSGPAETAAPAAICSIWSIFTCGLPISPCGGRECTQSASLDMASPFRAWLAKVRL